MNKSKMSGLCTVAAFLGLFTFGNVSPLSAGETFSSFIKGGNMNDIAAIEASGFVYKVNGVATDPFVTLKNYGMNYVVLQLWTSTGTAYDEAHVLASAKSVKAAGLKLVINFYYADGYNANLPAGWPTDIPSLSTKVYNYTRQILLDLQAQGTTPDMVKIGNEVFPWNAGFMLPEGPLTYNTSTNAVTLSANYITLTKQAIAAVRAFDPTIKILIHSACPTAAGNYNFYSQLVTQGVDYDVMALSWYQIDQGTLLQLQSVVDDLATNISKKVMVVECTCPWSSGDSGDEDTTGEPPYDGTEYYPVSFDGCSWYYQDMMQIVATAPNNAGVGVISWTTDLVGTYGTWGGSHWDNCCLWNTTDGNLNASAYPWKTTVNIGTGIVFNGVYKIDSFHDDNSLWKETNTSIQTTAYEAWSTQRWTLANVGGSSHSILSINNSDALTNASSTSLICSGAYSGASNQQWEIVPQLYGKFQIINVSANNPLWECTDTTINCSQPNSGWSTQSWHLTPTQ
jgi:arabinogalactan endo-1,4-beta-galactosidase